MRVPRVLAASLVAFIPLAGSADEDLTAAELARVLGIHSWRVPAPAKRNLWTIEVRGAVPLSVGGETLSTLPHGAQRALIALRDVGEGNYEFFLEHAGGESSSGTLAPCREPEGSRSICGSYGITFHDDPICLPGCKELVIAEIAPMLEPEPRKQVVIRVDPELVIDPSDGSIVIPLP